MRPDLPDEVLQRIVLELQTIEPAQVAQLSLVLPTQVRRVLHTRPLVTSSTRAQGYLRALQAAPSSLRTQATVLTVKHGGRKVLAQSTRNRKAAHELVEDAVKPDEILELSERLPNLVEVHILEPGFDSLRRRQVDFASRLHHLLSLTIAGRSGHGFHLHTIGQIMEVAPNLVKVALRNINSSPRALSSLRTHSCKLSSFALINASAISSGQLNWLLKAPIYADSLRSVLFDVPPGVAPSHFAPVKWAAQPVTRISVSATRCNVVHGIVQHFPSVRHFAFRSLEPVDPHAVLHSCASCGSVEVIEDRSPMSGGAAPFEWAEALVYARRTRGVSALKRLTLSNERRMTRGFAILEEVCDLLGIQLELYQADQNSTSGPWIPAEFAQLRPFEIE